MSSLSTAHSASTSSGSHWKPPDQKSVFQVDSSVLGLAAKVEVSKENCTIVGDGSTEAEVTARVKQIKRIVEETEQVCLAVFATGI